MIQNLKNLAVAEEANVDESITAIYKAINEMEIDLEEEHNTEVYQETMSIDIENIDKIDNSCKHYTKQWRTIYKFIQQEFFDEIDNFLDDFLKTLQE